MAGRKGRQRILRKSDVEAAEIEELDRRIVEGAPPPASSQPDTAGNSFALARKFSELPLSQHTQGGLKEAKFKSLTAIQRFALPQALCGRDVLGAAKTGSGKTLAFLVPLLEKLYRLKWGPLDGLGAMVISPTRELALQIFDELRKVGKRHEFSAGLLIGGNKVREEQERVRGMNILVCTPGRLLQHMDETPGFDSSNLQILVLDEADRILDMGFSATLNAIIENLPVERQTLLFSATQTKSVKQLARLSLKDPQYVAVHENAAAPTPAKLEQAYAICGLPEKLSILWSFIRSHLKAKILVFVSTTRQARFLFEAFRKLRPGSSLRCLHGNMKQSKRMAVFYDFGQATSGMVLFATDIAARGLDFTKLDWVLQMDCPEDTAAYIHRVGRTARYVSAGRGLLLLLPSEKAFIDQLQAARVPIKSIKINPNKTQPLQPALQALLSKFQELKGFAQSSMTAYLKSVHLAPNKAVFDVHQLPAEEYAASLGLLAPPKLSFMRRGPQTRPKFSQGALDSAEGRGARDPTENVRSVLGGRGVSAINPALPEEEEALLQVRKAQAQEPAPAIESVAAETATGPSAGETAKKKRKKLKIKPEALSMNRIVFDEDGAAVDPLAALAAASIPRGGGESLGYSTAAERYQAAAAVLKARDVVDKADYQERRRRRLADAKARQKTRDGGGAPAVVTLGPGLGYPGEESIALEGTQDASGEGDQADIEEGWDSELEEQAVAAIFGTKKRKRKEKVAEPEAEQHVEQAHFGMQSKKDVTGLSLAEQEALALKLLRT